MKTTLIFTLAIVTLVNSGIGPIIIHYMLENNEFISRVSFFIRCQRHKRLTFDRLTVAFSFLHFFVEHNLWPSFLPLVSNVFVLSSMPSMQKIRQLKITLVQGV